MSLLCQAFIISYACVGGSVQVAPDGIGVWNPGFDVTPASLIAGIITEKGVIRPTEKIDADGNKVVYFDVAGFFKQDSKVLGLMDNAWSQYYVLTEENLAGYLRDHVGHVWSRLGASSVKDVDVKEVSEYGSR